MNIQFYTQNSGLPKPEQAALERWLEYYDADNAMNQLFEEHSSLFTDDTATEQPEILQKLAEAAPDDRISPGQLRLLKSDAVLDPEQFTMVLVMSQWTGANWLIATFSRFPEPATTGELVLDGPTPTKDRVLQCWNAFSVPEVILLQHSLCLGQVSEATRVKACQMYFHLLVDDPLPEHEKFHCGPRIMSEIDPRIQYMNEEKFQVQPFQNLCAQFEENFAEFTAKFACRFEVSQTDSDELSLAAGDEEKIVEQKYQLMGTACQVVLRHLASKFTLLVIDDRGNDAMILDGSCVVGNSGEVLAVIAGGYATFDAPDGEGNLLLINVSGQPWQLKEVNL